MNTRELEIFIAVVEGGSFANAGKTCFVSPVAVMKHMNALEEEVGTQLLIRSSKGVEATDAGMYFYQEAKSLLLQLQDALNATKSIGRSDKIEIRVGTSLLKPPHLLIEAWEKIQTGAPSKYVIQLVPFEDSGQNIMNITSNLGKDIDAICAISAIPDWQQNCEVIILGHEDAFMAVPRSNPLSAKSCIDADDLRGQWVLVTRRGLNKVMDELADFARQHGASVVEFPNAYDLDAINYCIKHNALMFSFEYWAQVSPLISVVPIPWGHKMQVGLFYSKTPTKDVRGFISIFNKATEDGIIPL